MTFKRLKIETVLSLLMMAGALWLTKLKYDKLEILENGREVTVEIIDIPMHCGEGTRTRKPHFRFEYSGKTHRKDFRGLHCDEVQKGGTISLITNTNYSTFLFKDEDSEIKSDIAAFGGLAILFGILAIIGQGQKDKSFIPKQRNYKKEKKPGQPKMGRYGNKIE